MCIQVAFVVSMSSAVDNVFLSRPKKVDDERLYLCVYPFLFLFSQVEKEKKRVIELAQKPTPDDNKLVVVVVIFVYSTRTRVVQQQHPVVCYRASSGFTLFFFIFASFICRSKFLIRTLFFLFKI